jgi:hypothetical protein
MSSATIVSILAVNVTVALITSPPLSSSSPASSRADLNQTEAAKEMIGAYQNPIVDILANELETRINKSGAILEITSRLSEVNSAPFASSITSELHGIPKDADIQKRKVAQDILAADKDFQVIFFLMPNGDVYLVEPYLQQQNLTGNNFAFRDYYRGALDTRDTYLSNVIISAALGRPQTNIVVPMYSENNNGTLVGLWGCGLNVTMLSKSLQSLNLTDNQRIVYADRQGQKIADSDNRLSLNPQSSNESFADLQSFKNAINGESGSITEIINGTKMVVSYHPVKAFSNVWMVLLMEPYVDVVSDKTVVMQNYTGNP